MVMALIQRACRQLSVSMVAWGVFAHGSRCRHISLMDGLVKVGCPMLPEPTTAPAIFEEVRACGGGVAGHWTRTGQDLLS